MRYLLFFGLLLVLALPSAAYASGVLLSLNPENPRPNDRVTVTATLIAGDAKSSVFYWTVDGDPVQQGIGANVYTVDAPKAGGSKSIAVSVMDGKKIIASETLDLRPADVTIEWEGQSPVPPFFIGRPLLSGNGAVVATAVPSLVAGNGATIPAKDILFTWSLDGRIMRNSGYGVTTVSVQPPFFTNSFRLDVTAATRDGSLAAHDAVVIAPRTPEIVVYEQSPLGGLEDGRAVVGQYTFTQNEVSFLAYPLYVQKPEQLSFAWSLNNNPVTVETGNPRLVVFKKTAEGTGSYTVGVSFKNAASFLDRASHSFLLQF